MGPTRGPSGADRTQVGPMLAKETLLSGLGRYIVYIVFPYQTHLVISCIEQSMGNHVHCITSTWFLMFGYFRAYSNSIISSFIFRESHDKNACQIQFPALIQHKKYITICVAFGYNVVTYYTILHTVRQKQVCMLSDNEFNQKELPFSPVPWFLLTYERWPVILSGNSMNARCNCIFHLQAMGLDCREMQW